MPIAVLVLALVAYAFVMVAYPEYRTIGLALGGAAGAGLGAYFWLTEPEATRAAARLPAAELVLEDVAVEPSLRGATLTGRVRNDSPSFRLREMTLALRLRDCPEETSPAEACPVIAEAEAIARPDVPPGQIRAFTARFILASVRARSLRRPALGLGGARDPRYPIAQPPRSRLRSRRS